MACAACMKARQALKDAVKAAAHGNAREAGAQTAVMFDALGEKIESLRVRAMLTRKR